MAVPKRFKFKTKKLTHYIPFIYEKNNTITFEP